MSRSLRNYLWSAALLGALQVGVHAQTTISFTGSPLSQNFDVMGPTGTNTPSGWFVGSNAATAINYTTNVTVSDGSVANAGGIRGFNFGTAAAADRTLGTAPTGTDRFIEARIRNNTIFSIDMFTVTYDGEQWRNGNNSLATNANKLVLQYSTDGTNYVDLGAAFNFNQLVDTPQAAALDGNAPGNRTAGIGGTYAPAGSVPPGGTIFLRWFDDNELQTDPGLGIDSFNFSGNLVTEPTTIAISSPTNTQCFPFSADVPVSVNATGTIINVAFFVDGNYLSTDATRPYTATVPTALLPLGDHILTAVATNIAAGSTTNSLSSAPITITIKPNQPPTIVITNLADGTNFLVGTAIPVNAQITDDTGVTNVDWFVDGNFYVRRAGALGFTYVNSLAGSHTFFGIATDRAGDSAPSAAVTVMVTNPPLSVARLVENGQPWRYYSASSAPPLDGSNQDWTQPLYDDTAWLVGDAELGNGDAADGYPERTAIDIGPNGARNISVYFRHKFDGSAVSGQDGSLVLRLLRDDGALVHLNGAPVWTNNIPAATNGPVIYSTLAAASDDGIAYQVIALNPALILPGDNTVAVEVHQNAATSSDLSFDLMVWYELAVTPEIVITAPTNNATVIASSDVTVNISASTFVNAAHLFLDGVEVGLDATRPFSLVISNIAVGPHMLRAVGDDMFAGPGSAVSTVINITATPSQPPTVSFTNIFSGGVTGTVFLVGSCITNQFSFADDVRVAKLELYVDGALHFSDSVAPFGQILVNDALVGTHVFAAVVMDNGGLSGTNTVTIEVTNPPNVTVLVANGSTWKYDNSSNDLATAWQDLTYDDSLWASGPGDLGGGNANENNPERTSFDIGPAAGRLPTVYFRHVFSVSNPNAFTNLILNVLRDDGVAVYVNQQQIMRNNLAAGAAFVAFASAAAGDDGTAYIRANVNPTNLVSGDNILAVEIHNANATSSDLTFDLMLWGQSGGPILEIQLISLAPAGTEVRWSEPGAVLQESDDPAGTYTDVPGNPPSPYTPTLGVQKFYRLRIP